LRQWRSWDPRLLWRAVVDVLATLLLISFLLTGHHQAVARVWAVLAWVVIVAAISAPGVKTWLRQRP
jgi:hypothetical protein